MKLLDTKPHFYWFLTNLAKTQSREVFVFLVLFLLKTHTLAPIVVEILLIFPLKSKRLKRIAG
ncbi:hypothetical protein BHE19_19930 [Flavobacterium tructae]|uniref:Uncharacterized protein n=1 Tax=Flavobacterium tructae TaxID=1114873 RepID=A0A1S1JGF2_9FLAO|nr:hypothetical protein BHE19_19930 [Flavobacterium tructae]